MAQLSRRDIDEIKPSIDKIVIKVLGSDDISVISTASKCLIAGYDRHKTEKKLSSLVEDRKAEKITDKLFDMVDTYLSSSKSRKRGHESESRESRDSKKSKRDGDPVLSANRIKEMMENAQKEILERKRQLDPPPAGKPVVPPPVVYSVPPSGLINRGEAEKARKIAQLQAQIRNKLSSGILNNPILQAVATPADKPTPLILDAEGRTVDITGKAIQLTHITPTLKANIRAKKREEFKAQYVDKNIDDVTDAKFFDDRIGNKPALRNKRALKFHEPGKFQQLADRIRMKVKFQRYFVYI